MKQYKTTFIGFCLAGIGTAASAAVPIIDLNQDNNNTYSTPAPVTPSDDSQGLSTYPADNAGNVPAAAPPATPVDQYPTTATPVPVASDQPSKENMPLEVRIRLLEQQINNLTQMNLPSKIDSLQQQLQQLSGQLEVAQHNIDTLTEQQRNFYQDLDQRIRKLGGGSSSVPNASASSAVSATTTTPAPSPTQTTTATSADNHPSTDTSLAGKIAQAEANVTQNQPAAGTASSENDESAYQAAFKLYSSKQNTAATKAFKSFLVTYPNSSYAPNTRYWLAMLYDNAGNQNQALKEFNILVQKYPTHDKAPYAMLKIAEIHNDQGLTQQAQQEWQKIIKLYPGSTAANLANTALQTTENAPTSP